MIDIPIIDRHVIELFELDHDYLNLITLMDDIFVKKYVCP
jgi:hypothetical protein